MGRTHSNAFRQAPNFFDLRLQTRAAGGLRAQSGRADTFATRWGYASFETDWRKLVDRKDIDLIDIATPNDTHAEIAIAAANAGKMVMCEKPLGEMRRRPNRWWRRGRRPASQNMVWYNYRAFPPSLAKAAGRRRTLWTYLSLPHEVPTGLDDFEELPQGGEGLWRLDARLGQRRHGRSAGARHRHGNLAEWHHREVSAMTETFIKPRTHTLTGIVQPVDD